MAPVCASRSPLNCLSGMVIVLVVVSKTTWSIGMGRADEAMEMKKMTDNWACVYVFVRFPLKRRMTDRTRLLALPLV